MKTFQEFLTEDLYTANPIKISIGGKQHILFSDVLPGVKFNPVTYLKSFDTKEVQDIMSQISYTRSREGYRFIIIGAHNRPKHALVWTSEVIHSQMAAAVDLMFGHPNLPDVKISPFLKDPPSGPKGYWAFTAAFQPSLNFITDAAITPYQAMEDIDFKSLFRLSDSDYERMFE
jgi:hypothetical protein